uniref:Calpain catalytic domain-containing protein n=1 Tax=Noctiluca scintillans TaxID=2966 RepID=A0A7S0ZYF5_NOCSC
MNHDSELGRAEWDQYVAILPSYPDTVITGFEEAVAQLNLSGMTAHIDQMTEDLPEGWEKVPSQSRPGQFTYVNQAMGVKVKSLSEARTVSAQHATSSPAKPDLPPGFKMVPSQSEPGQFRIFDPSTNKKFLTAETAWKVYNERAARQQTTTPESQLQIALEMKKRTEGSQASSRPSAHPEVVPAAAEGKFTDPAFPPTLASLGSPKPGRSFIKEEARQATQWIRLPELIRMTEGLPADAPVKLWEQISPEGITQGQVGDCWLIAAIAALAEFPSIIKKCFKEVDQERGRYVIRIFDMATQAWEDVEIDDHVPCIRKNLDGSMREPLQWVTHFAMPGGYMWAPLLEKAMAKFVGTYAFIAGGTEPFALIALTGYPLIYEWIRTNAKLGEWDCNGAQYIGRDAPGMPERAVEGIPPFEDDKMWEKICEYDQRNFVMCAEIYYQQPTRPDALGFFRPDGLILKHAYSLIGCRTATKASGEQVRLVMIRNPHGKVKYDAAGNKMSTDTEWNGDWSDSSPLWTLHPEVVQQVDFAPMNDGIFWMPWDDFKTIYDTVIVLPKSMSEPRAGVAFHRRQEMKQDICVALQNTAEQSGTMKQDLINMSIMFDPFVFMRGFEDDPDLERQLLEIAKKPGALQRTLDSMVSVPLQHDWYVQKVKSLGLDGALGATGHI